MNRLVVAVVVFSVAALGAQYIGWSDYLSTEAVPLADVPGISTTRTEAVAAPLAESVPETGIVSDDAREYKNTAYRFALRYPKGLTAREYKERDKAINVTFQDPETNAGFQIYVTPYSGDHIDDARFKLDQPSGVMKDPRDVVIDGVRGTMFFGRNSIMGDTREVWFIRGGFLYEVVTFKQLDEWLGEIMKTWKFL